jgi:hypothetical protein
MPVAMPFALWMAMISALVVLPTWQAFTIRSTSTARDGPPFRAEIATWALTANEWLQRVRFMRTSPSGLDPTQAEAARVSLSDCRIPRV